MITFRTANFNYLYAQLAGALMNGDTHEVGEWHAQKMPVQFLETYNVMFELNVPVKSLPWAIQVQPNLPWAEDHFQERVSGTPLNPPPSSEYWPFAQNGHSSHVDEEGKFSHTYPERYWPKWVGQHSCGDDSCSLQEHGPNVGTRYGLGDLYDVVQLLIKSPMTRQAYLPVWFPEDTGALCDQRVPCSLGYHFMIRNGYMHCSYTIRSCDFYRHFRDDVYMTGRLLQWMCEQVDSSIKPGSLNVHIHNLHTLRNELSRLVMDATEMDYNGAEDGHVETDA